MNGYSCRRPTWRMALLYAGSAGVPQRSLRIALVVGSVLNLINQGDALFGAAPVNWIRLALTYLVPYAVSTYGVVSYRLGVDRANRRICPNAGEP